MTTAGLNWYHIEHNHPKPKIDQERSLMGTCCCHSLQTQVCPLSDTAAEIKLWWGPECTYPCRWRWSSFVTLTLYGVGLSMRR